MRRRCTISISILAAFCGLASSACLSGCMHTAPPRMDQPYDAVIVPGCPSMSDGRLSKCQSRRAAWAAIIWERGLAKRFITSGSAVYSPYVEAYHLAAALTALGVPADRIYLEPHALHTDENMYNSLAIARRLGLGHLAVATDRLQAVGACGMMTGWGGLCTPLPLEETATRDKLSQVAEQLALVRIDAVDTWRPLSQVETERAQRTGRRRLPSALLYPWMWLQRMVGRTLVPNGTSEPAILRWSEQSESTRQPS